MIIACVVVLSSLRNRDDGLEVEGHGDDDRGDEDGGDLIQ